MTRTLPQQTAGRKCYEEVVNVLVTCYENVIRMLQKNYRLVVRVGRVASILRGSLSYGFATRKLRENYSRGI